VAAEDPEVVGEGDDGFLGLRLGIPVGRVDRDVLGNGGDVGAGLRSGESAERDIFRHGLFLSELDRTGRRLQRKPKESWPQMNTDEWRVVTGVDRR